VWWYLTGALEITFTAALHDMNATDVGLLTITINFDPHLTQLFTPLCCGASLVIAKPEGHTDGGYMLDTMHRYGVTHYSSTPSLALVHFRGEEARKCTSLKCALFGGEQLPWEVVHLFRERVSLTLALGCTGRDFVCVGS